MLADNVAVPYPYLNQTLQQLVALPQFNVTTTQHGQASVSKYDGQGPLVVRVFSFSYKKAFPKTLQAMEVATFLIVVAHTIQDATSNINLSQA